MKTRVLSILKPKVASYGFSKDSIDSFATTLAENIKEDATEEEVNAQVNAVIPFFKISQSEITRIVNNKKDEPKDEKVLPPKVEPTEDEVPDDKLDKLYKLIELQGQQIADLSNNEKSKSRRTVYAEKLKDLPETLRNSMTRKFERISFKDNEDFENFLAEEDKDIPELLKEHSARELDEMGKPVRGGHIPDKEATAEEVTEIIKNLNI